MATPTQQQPYAQAGNPYPPAPAQQSAQGYGADVRPPQSSAQGQYGGPPQQTPISQFDKFCVIHIATTCDEHGVYVTKDSAEVIEIGWVVVDARDPDLPEVCLILSTH
jgi:hypothetical protein